MRRGDSTLKSAEADHRAPTSESPRSENSMIGVIGGMP